MTKYFVKATERENVCDSRSAIKSLALDQNFNGVNIYAIHDLKGLADAGMLYVNSVETSPKPVRVRIFWSTYYSRWIATTRADDYACNNLLSLPIYYPKTSGYGSSVTYTYCEYR